MATISTAGVVDGQVIYAIHVKRIVDALDGAASNNIIIKADLTQGSLTNTTNSTNSHAEGEGTTASGNFSHSEGENTTASGNYSHAEGDNSTSSGNHSHAEGKDTEAQGIASHAEGEGTLAVGDYSHAEGYFTIAYKDYQTAVGQYNKDLNSTDYFVVGVGTAGDRKDGLGVSDTRTFISNSLYLPNLGDTAQSYVLTFNNTSKQVYYTSSNALAASVTLIAAPPDQAIQFNSGSTFSGSRHFRYIYSSESLHQGENVTASGEFSHAQGRLTWASGSYSHAEGRLTQATEIGAHAEGNITTASGIYAHSEGFLTIASAQYAHAEGSGSRAIAAGAHSEGNNTLASGKFSHAEGYFTTASGDYSHAEGYETRAIGNYSHVEGRETVTTITGLYSHAEGYQTTASGEYSHAEGYQNEAQGNYSHAEGYLTLASGLYSHAQGGETTASGNYSFAGGFGTIASGIASHAEGQYTTASGNYSHAEGRLTVASEQFSHAGGFLSLASGQASTAIGHFATASNAQSIAIGYGVVANLANQTALGSYNSTGSTDDNFLIGNGSGVNDRKTAIGISTILNRTFISTSLELPTLSNVNSGFVLSYNTSSKLVNYIPNPAVTPPAAPDKSIQYNNGGVFGGKSNFVFDYNINKVTLTGSMFISGSAPTSSLTLVGSGSNYNTFQVLGTQGSLLTVTDVSSGSLFSVNDISGYPILDVFSDSTVLLGDYTYPAYHTTGYVITTGAGPFKLGAILTSSYDGGYFECVIKNGVNSRAESITVNWNNSTIVSSSIVTADIGTVGVTLFAALSGSYAVLSGSAPGAGWTIKSIIRAI